MMNKQVLARLAAIAVGVAISVYFSNEKQKDAAEYQKRETAIRTESAALDAAYKQQTANIPLNSAEDAATLAKMETEYYTASQSLIGREDALFAEFHKEPDAATKRWRTAIAATLRTELDLLGYMSTHNYQVENGKALIDGAETFNTKKTALVAALKEKDAAEKELKTQQLKEAR